LGGAFPERDSGRKAGFNRLKNEGFQALLSDSILACGKGEKEGRKEVVRGIPRVQLRAQSVTLVIYMITI
jgi:hypothetical protein